MKQTTLAQGLLFSEEFKNECFTRHLARMNSKAWYVVGIVVLAVVAGIFGAMWYVANVVNQNYSVLQAQYTHLQLMYSSLKNNYTNLQIQYNNLLSNYSQLQNKYQNLQSQYNQLQGQYNTMETKYDQLQSQYSNLVSAFSSAESFNESVYVDPGGSLMFPIIVPNGYNATVSIYASSSDYIGVLITTLSSMNTAISVVPTRTSATLYIWSGYTINEQITLQPGIYLIGVGNYPNNTAGAYINIQITTTLSS
jgi:hypothetical protein